jgi:prepilin-type N-terminal cleavage/methylation domain-containing protein
MYRIPHINIKGFTLVELIIVMAVISAMITVITPYATRSNNSLKLKEQCRNLAETTKYALNFAQVVYKPTRLVIDTKTKSYQVEIMAENGTYEPLQTFAGTTQYMASTISIGDLDGFEMGKDSSYLIFDPEKPWPSANISLLDNDSTATIKIQGKQVDLEEQNI